MGPSASGVTFCSTLGGTLSVMGVVMNPGSTTLQRIPNLGGTMGERAAPLPGYHSSPWPASPHQPAASNTSIPA